MFEEQKHTFEDMGKVRIDKNANIAKNIAIVVLLMINIAQFFSINSLVKTLETQDIFLTKIQHDFQTTLDYLEDHNLSIPDDLMNKLYIKKAPIEKF